jgi:hypothetical protein
MMRCILQMPREYVVDINLPHRADLQEFQRSSPAFFLRIKQSAHWDLFDELKSIASTPAKQPEDKTNLPQVHLVSRLSRL